MQNLNIVYRPISNLKARDGNPRTHSTKQIRQVADSIKEFGFLIPVLVDAENRLIAGHCRVEAARLLGLEKVPTIRAEHLSEAQIRAYVIADNKLTLNADWDIGLLKIEFEKLNSAGFELTLTGYETAEIDQLLIVEEAGEDTDDSQPDFSKPAISRLGDMWRIGRHCVLCADATKPESYARLLNGEKAQLVFSDPPFNVPIKGHVSGLGKVKHEEFAMASGEMSQQEFTRFLASVFRNLVDYSVAGSIHYICMDWRHMREIQDAAQDTYAELKNLCIWNKTNGGMGSFYRSQHELVFVYQNGAEPHINNVELGKNGRYRTNVWTYAGANTFGKERDEALAMHPTVKPVAMVADAIKDASNRNDIILDAFGGSGTTLVAAERTGRRGYALEISPAYVDTIVKRISKETGQEAILAGTNESFDAVAQWRASGLDEEIEVKV